MRTFLMALALCVVANSFATDIAYSVMLIPKELIKDANVVKRMEEETYELISTGEAVHRVKYALTILNENGDDAAALVLWYNKYRNITSLEGNLYNAAGANIRKLKIKEVKDESAVSSISLIDDSRVKFHHFYHKEYPYTVEYTYEMKLKQTMFFPGWVPQPVPGMAVQQSSFTLITPAAYSVRYKAANYAREPVTTSEKSSVRRQWQTSNVPARYLQFAAPHWQDLSTRVYMGPTDFEIEGYKGNMANWQEFGKFIYTLKKDRDILPPAVVAKVKELTAGVDTDMEKAKILYHYLQQNTRYISIQLGIGGWQPFEATSVAQNGYGDCKALTNYMYSLLKAANIRSLYTLVNAGSSKSIVEDFPAQQFNHVILCVPFAKDTLWLECTSQTDAAGYMGSFTGNRKALIVDESGGKLVATPRYGLTENLQKRTVKGSLDAEGNMEAAITTLYTGLQQDDVQGKVEMLTKDKLKEKLNKELSISTYDVKDFKYTQTKDVLPQIKEELTLSVSRMATASGKRLFIVPNLLNQNGTKLSTDEPRQYDFVFEFAFRDEDSVVITLPAGYTPEAMPKDVKLNTRFGNYTATVKLEEGKLFYYRLYERVAGKFPVTDANDIASFLADVYKADRNKVVLIKKD